MILLDTVILLDTDVLSEFMRPSPDAAVVDWVDAQPPGSVWTTSVTVFEIEYGLRCLPRSRRRTRLEEQFRIMLHEDLEGRVVAFDTVAALRAGALAAGRKTKGRPLEIRDLWIASMALVAGAVVATRNVRHFEKACRVVDPWETR